MVGIVIYLLVGIVVVLLMLRAVENNNESILSRRDKIWGGVFIVIFWPVSLCLLTISVIEGIINNTED